MSPLDLRLIEAKDPKTWTAAETAAMAQYLKRLEEDRKVKEGLPHLFGFPFYHWARLIFESRSREILCTAANQVSKSSTAIRKNIHWATAIPMWKELWPELVGNQAPNLFWYFYPTKEVCSTEFSQKWEPLFLPRGDYKNDKQFGWKEEWFKGEIHSINFHSGVQIQFKTYAQKVKDLQSSSVYMVTADEEMPVEYLPELSARLNATSGYFMSVFTATLGQEHWRKAMEPTTPDEETHKDALKLSVSLFDCKTYEDGSPSPWTEAKINRAIQNCPTDAEVQRRVHGRFVKTEGLAYESFSLDKNMTEARRVPDDWQIYSAVDPGSGGKSGHPAAIVFLAVSPDRKKGEVFRVWRGDGIPTTSSDILRKYRELRGQRQPVQQKYDYAAKDFFMVASNAGEAFSPADKGRDRGVALLNTLFKNKMLLLHKGEPEIDKLSNELLSLPAKVDKSRAHDDLVDALRYAAMAASWDFSGIEFQMEGYVEDAGPQPKSESEQRREWFLNSDQKPAEMSPDMELDYWNEMLD